jgi:EF hand domain-containing protein
MKKLITISLLSALALGGVALAQGPGHHGRMLEKLDQNHDGKLTKAEVQNGALTRFNEIDANKDGKVTKEELTAHRQAKMAEHEARKDDAGRKPHGGRGEWRARMGEHFFAKLDTNKDGTVDAKELGADLNDRFETMDVNGDGVVDAEEIASGFGHGGQCGRGAHEHAH